MRDRWISITMTAIYCLLLLMLILGSLSVGRWPVVPLH